MGFTRLALLCFAKIGCGSEAQIKKSVFCFGLHSPCTTLLREDRLRLGSPNQKKCFLLWASLALHCFASRRQAAARKSKSKKVFFALGFARLALSLHLENIGTLTIMINRELIRLKVVQLVYSYYQNEGKTIDMAEKELNFSLQKAYDLYQYLLSLLVELEKHAERKDAVRVAREKRTGAAVGGISPDKQFADNKLLCQLDDNKALIDYRENRKGQWPEEDAFVKKLYAKMVESDIYEMYITKEDFSYEADREVVRKLYKTFVCNNDDFDALLEEHSLYWNDDKQVVDSFVMKTIKRFDEKSTPEQELLPEYAADEDRLFAGKLFEAALERGAELRDIIRAHTKNWEFNRLAFMDVIIMQIALAEILTFDSIPLNVTFNEYLDIAKVYSTPRSSSYINGMLDGIVKELAKEGRITKVRERKVKKEADNK